MDTENDGLQDRAIVGKVGDLLDRSPFVENLVRALVSERRNTKNELVGHLATGNVVGLTGAWGLGKTSIMAMTAERLQEMKKVVPVVFNPWLFSGRDELLEGFFGELRQSIGSTPGESARLLRDQVDRYWGVISFAAKTGAIALGAINGDASVASAATANVDDLRPGRSQPRSAMQERNDLEKKLLASNLAVVVLIDEVDRLEDQEVRAVAQLVKAVGEIKGISYLVAYEPGRVADALGRGEGPSRIESGERYIEKIIQHPIPVRPLFYDDVEKLLELALAGRSEILPEPDNEQIKILESLKAAIHTPREVKRMVGSFSIIHRAVRGEVCPFDTLAYSWMSSRSPTLQKQIADNLDKLVDDPSSEEMSSRITAGLDKNERPTVTDILGESARHYDVILRLLFPRFGHERHADEQHGMRISRRQNLIRLLYLGDPPTLVSRKLVEGIWSTTDINRLVAKLKELKQEDRLISLLDRLDDFLDRLAPEGDEIFWPALAKIIERNHDWIKEPNVDRGIAEDAAMLIIRLGIRNDGDRDRAKKIFHLLVRSGDLAITPYIVRKHLFHYGLTKHSTRSKDEMYVFSPEEVQGFLQTELDRYRRAILNGKALRRVPNVEAIYAIGNRNEWDDELRASFTDQLRGAEAIATWASLLVPPGYSTDKKNLKELLDTDLVLERLESLGPPAQWAGDPWILGSVERLRSILQGRDPLF